MLFSMCDLLSTGGKTPLVILCLGCFASFLPRDLRLLISLPALMQIGWSPWQQAVCVGHAEPHQSALPAARADSAISSAFLSFF